MRSVIKADHGSNRHRRESADLKMTTSLIAPAAQVCAFARGCGLTHAARAHAAAVSRALAARAIVSADRVPPGSSRAGAPDDDMSLDDITTDNGA